MARPPAADRDSPEGTREPRIDPTGRTESLLRDLRADRAGLTSLDAARRLARYGPNELTRRAGEGTGRQIAHQLLHPLALLLWAAAALALVAGIAPVAIAVVLVILLNAAFAFVQERHAERAVEALAAYLPAHAVVLRDGRRQEIEVRELVPGDILMIVEGDRISADCRLLEGSLELDMSALTGESVAVERDAAADDGTASILAARELAFSGTTCTGGGARALVFATGMHTELGRIAALSERVTHGQSRLEHQVRRIAWLIAAIAVVMGVAFIPITMIGAGLPLQDAVMLAIGLLVGNVPEGLLPVITLALAVAVRDLVRSGALVKRLSAVETLGSTTVICTDKTGTLTENRMRAVAIWTAAGTVEGTLRRPDDAVLATAVTALADSMTGCCNAELVGGSDESAIGDPTEIAMLRAAAAVGVSTDPIARRRRRRAEYRFSPELKLMSTIDEHDGAVWVNVKGAPEAVLPRCATIADPNGASELDAERVREVTAAVDLFAATGLRVLAIARREIAEREIAEIDRDTAERELCLLGLIAMIDPPRAEVADAVARCHLAGIRIHVVTGDHGLTARAIAREVGIAGGAASVVDGPELDAMSAAQLSALLAGGDELIFARSSPEAKLRIADALRELGEVVAMTGDGVNDAPALRAADIGVAMGRSGTDVAREASTIVLTDDNFATIIAAVEGGRRVYDNIRKFIFYIFAHATPEVTPFLVFGLAGGAVPLPLTVMQLLAFDVGTETLPALALGREPAEPDIMRRPPRSPDENVVQREMLVRAWLFLGVISAALSMAIFFWVLSRSGWSPGDPTGVGSALHEDYLRATTMTFLSMVACQIGTALAARSDRASLFEIGFASNPMLLWGILFEIVFVAVLVYAPPFQALLGTATPRLGELLVLIPCPVIVWGADDLRRRAGTLRRRRAAPRVVE
ncbi:MAG: cation-transporting P-type ATPase [Solirubrobacterales bacterium]